jgi:hypothetical protein
VVPPAAPVKPSAAPPVPKVADEKAAQAKAAKAKAAEAKLAQAKAAEAKAAEAKAAEAKAAAAVPAPEAAKPEPEVAMAEPAEVAPPPVPAPAPATPEPSAAPAEAKTPELVAAVTPQRAEVERFFSDWESAIANENFALYSSLGLPGNEQFFRSNYSQAKLTIALHDVQQVAPDQLRVSVQMVLERGGKRSDEERKLLILQTPGGMRYSGPSE